MDRRKISEIGDSMTGTLWKYKEENQIYILKEKYITTKGNEHYVFIEPNGHHVVLRAFFVEKSMTKIA